MVAVGHEIDRAFWIVAFVLLLFWIAFQLYILLNSPGVSGTQLRLKKVILIAAELASILMLVRQVDKFSVFGIYPFLFPLLLLHHAAVLVMCSGYYYILCVTKLNYFFMNADAPPWLGKTFAVVAFLFWSSMFILDLLYCTTYIKPFNAMVAMMVGIFMLATSVLIDVAFIPVVRALRRHVTELSKTRRAITQTIRELTVTISVSSVILVGGGITMIIISSGQMRWQKVPYLGEDPNKYTDDITFYDAVVFVLLCIICYVSYSGIRVDKVTEKPDQTVGHVKTEAGNSQRPGSRPTRHQSKPSQQSFQNHDTNLPAGIELGRNEFGKSQDLLTSSEEGVALDVGTKLTSVP